MCRNITTLRGLEPPATAEEIEAAARQYVRKVTGVQSLSDATREPFERAVAEVAAITARLLGDLPARRRPPTTIPPLRRPEVRDRLAAAAHDHGDHDHDRHHHGDGDHHHGDSDHHHGDGDHHHEHDAALLRATS